MRRGYRAGPWVPHDSGSCDYPSRAMATETTLVLVKPDGVSRGLCGEIVSRFERRGYELRGARLLKVTRALAQQHYAEHKGKPFFGELVSFITSGSGARPRRPRRERDRGRPHDDGRHQPGRLGAGHDPRRLRHAPLGEHRARLRLEGQREARARAVLPRRTDLIRATSPGPRPRGRRITAVPEISDDARRNREDWTQANAAYTDANAAGKWAEQEITWGVWSVPEDEPRHAG